MRRGPPAEMATRRSVAALIRKGLTSPTPAPRTEDRADSDGQIVRPEFPCSGEKPCDEAHSSPVADAVVRAGESMATPVG